MLDNRIMMAAVIFTINVVYVSLNTIRVILTMKGQKYLAALISMVEVVIYVVGLGLVLDNLDEIQNLLAYALGFGAGIISGMKLEEKLALGYITVHIITKEYEKNLPKQLRDKGYGVTSWETSGREGARLAMEVLTPRKYESRLYSIIKELDPSAFIVSFEPKAIYGGFWVKLVRKRLRIHGK